jgi:exodeoxyribonuclease V beta subunit
VRPVLDADPGTAANYAEETEIARRMGVHPPVASRVLSVDQLLTMQAVVEDEEAVRGAVAGLAQTGPGVIAVEVTDPSPEHFEAPAASTEDLGISTFDRGFDRTWVRTSYTSLTAAVHRVGALSLGVSEVGEVDERAKLDEPDVEPGQREPRQPTPLTGPLPLGEVPGGARVGTLVHEILERTDFAVYDLPAALRMAAAQVGARRLLDSHTDALVAGLAAALITPLGPVFSGRRLCDLPRGDRLDELTFDLPLAGGNTPDGVVTMEAVADIFATSLPSDDPVSGYHERLRDPLLASEVRGFLTGSIDLVARFAGCHVVVDYKTSRLAPAGEQHTAWHYRPQALLLAMYDAHYPLQAALYLVALHRYLRWRLPSYDPARHLIGAAYLFLRGMSGPDVAVVDGQPCGVFVWTPPADFVTRLSDLLDRGAT